MSSIPKENNPISGKQLCPISILPVLSKVFEKLVAAQMSEFTDEVSLLHDHMSSYCKGHSTTTALIGIRDDILRAMKKGEVTLMVLADFSKAFDTLCFHTTIHKLSKLSFSKPFLRWLVSYLSDRSQFVHPVWNTRILRPLAFNLYVVDLRYTVPLSTKCIQYADDTILC